MRNVSDLRLPLAGVAAVVFGASAYAAIGDALASYSPGPLALLRMLVASVTFAVYAVFTGVRLPEVRDVPAAVLAGLLAFALYNVALNAGQLSASAGVASLIIASIPLFTALMAVGLLGERLGARGWSSIAIGFFGVAMITVGGGRRASASARGRCWFFWPPSPAASTSPSRNRTWRSTGRSLSPPTLCGLERFCSRPSSRPL